MKRNRRIVRIKKRKYSYEDMERDCRRLRRKYPEYLGVGIIGKTVDQRNLYGIRLGNPSASRCVVVNASMHGREWLNTQMLLLSLEYCCRKMRRRSRRGKEYNRLFEEVCVYLLPMMNPDGVAVSQYGAGAIRNPKLRGMAQKMAGKKSRLWKANARGVDLNRNFNSGFGKDKAGGPSFMEYGGEKPLSEPETRALADLIETMRPAAVVNYHETGPMIYYTHRSQLLHSIQKMTGYPAVWEKEGCPGSFGDWLSERGIVWCTVETCRGKAPVAHWQIYPCYRKNYAALAVTAATAVREDRRR